MNKEIKQHLGDFELKATEEGKGDRTFSGYLARFGNKDSYGDIIEKGAFSVDLSKWKSKGYFPPVLEQHGGWGVSSSDNTPVGMFSSMEEDDKGLYVEGKLFTTSKGEDIYRLLKEAPKGFMGMSIGYQTVRKEIIDMEDGSRIRILKELKLLEGSIVTFPANEEARVEDVKSNKTLTVRQVENVLKDDCELSKKQAETVISKLKQLGWPITEGKSEEEMKELVSDNIQVKDSDTQTTEEKSSDSEVSSIENGLDTWVEEEKKKAEEAEKKRKLESLFKEMEDLIK